MTTLNFEKQTALLIEIIGTVVSSSSFVLKGGTAINFFYSNMPRLSVDIDLAYSKINSREEFISENKDYCTALEDKLVKKHGLSVQILKTSDQIPKQLLVSSNDSQIKIDINLVLRGSVYPTVIRPSCKLINEKYGVHYNIHTLSFEDLYAGKFCAALDRQHPRDLFDVKLFFEKHIITDKLKKAFLVYLISGNRPISELINPNRLDQRKLFMTEFVGMTDEAVTYESLEIAREELIESLRGSLNEDDKQFLITFKAGDPNWDFLEIDHIKNMPAIKWKLQNTLRMDKSKHKASLQELIRKLNN